MVHLRAPFRYGSCHDHDTSSRRRTTARHTPTASVASPQIRPCDPRWHQDRRIATDPSIRASRHAPRSVRQLPGHGRSRRGNDGRPRHRQPPNHLAPIPRQARAVADRVLRILLRRGARHCSIDYRPSNAARTVDSQSATDALGIPASPELPIYSLHRSRPSSGACRGLVSLRRPPFTRPLPERQRHSTPSTPSRAARRQPRSRVFINSHRPPFAGSSASCPS